MNVMPLRPAVIDDTAYDPVLHFALVADLRYTLLSESEQHID